MDDRPGAPTPPPTAPADRIATLEAELAAAQAEVHQNHERWVRERADLENLKRRAAKEQQDAARFGSEALLRDLLPVVDNLERAAEHARSVEGAAAVVDGIALVLKAFHDVLERNGVSRVQARGEPFDPSHHEAVAHVESAGHPPGTVIDEYQAGYRLRERLLRPAMVTVAKAPAGPRGDLANGEGRG
jgi:molecular chaperone GrpE